jgi:hypothetical protein
MSTVQKPEAQCPTCDGLLELSQTDGQKIPSVATAIERSRALHGPNCPRRATH